MINNLWSYLHSAQCAWELKHGEKLAAKLVEHMKAMGADAGIIPVVRDGEEYEIIIRPKKGAA